MSDHTKGPWIIDRYGQLNDRYGNQVMLCNPGIATTGEKAAKFVGNTKLLHASPDMFDILDALANKFYHKSVDIAEYEIIAQNAALILSKINGETT